MVKAAAQAMKIRVAGDRRIVCEICGWDELLPERVDVWSVWQQAQRHWDAHHAEEPGSKGS